MGMEDEDERNGFSPNTPLLLHNLEDLEADSGDQIHSSRAAATSFFTTYFNGLNALSGN